METVQILKDARALISDEKNWTQGEFARTTDGVGVQAVDHSASCFCTIGAIDKCTNGRGMDSDAYYLLLGIVSDDYLGVADFNDTNTHPEVLALFDRAIERAESERVSA